MAKRSLLNVPPSCIFRGRKTPETSRSGLETFPSELICKIFIYSDIVSRVNFARCSKFLIESARMYGLLDFDTNNLSHSDWRSITGAIPFDVRPPRLLKTSRDLSLLFSEGDLKCDYCGWHKEYNAFSMVGFFTHLKFEHRRREGLVTPNMHALLRKGIGSITAWYETKLSWAEFLTLRLPSQQEDGEAAEPVQEQDDEAIGLQEGEQTEIQEPDKVKQQQDEQAELKDNEQVERIGEPNARRAEIQTPEEAEDDVPEQTEEHWVEDGEDNDEPMDDTIESDWDSEVDGGEYHNDDLEDEILDLHDILPRETIHESDVESESDVM